jgi:hypothetical protein
MPKRELIEGETVFNMPEGATEDSLEPLDLEGCDNVSEELLQLIEDFAKVSAVVKEKTLEKDEIKGTVLEIWDGVGSPVPTPWGRVKYVKGSKESENVDGKKCVELLEKSIGFDTAIKLLKKAGFDETLMKGILGDAVGKFKLPMKKTAARSATLAFEGL